MNGRSRIGPNKLKRLVAFLRRKPRRVLDFGEWQEPPPDIGVREPRRPKPSSGTGSAVLDPPA